MLKINIGVTNTTIDKVHLIPYFYNKKYWKHGKTKWGASLENLQPIGLRIKSSSHVYSNYDDLFKKIGIIVLVILIREHKLLWITKWALLEQESYLNVKNYLSLSQSFGNWKKNITMVFELMVSLCTEICFNFAMFYIWVALEDQCHFKNFIEFYMSNR